MMMPNYKELLKPYGIVMELTLKWLREQSGASQEVIDLVIANTLLKLAQGVKWSTEGCSCGCGMTNPNTAIEHYMLREVKRIQGEAARAYAEVLEKAEHSRILTHIQVENDKFVQENMKPTLWQRITGKK